MSKSPSLRLVSTSRIAPVRHGRQGQTRIWRTAVKLVGAGLAVLLVSGAATAGIAVWQLASSAKPSVHLAGQPTVTPPAIGATEGAVTMLLVGTDTRSGQGGAFSSKSQLSASSGAGNNDVNILIHIAQDHQSVTVVSFPRDLEIPVPACPTASGGTFGASSQAMLNTTLSRGGLSCAVLTISKLTGIPIPYAAEITFDGVSAMSDAVGGVSVCLATPVKDPYTDPALDLPAGQVTLVGPQALSFLRSRHGVGDGSDLGRISNQQVFMSALVRKLETGGVLGNPLKLFPLAEAAVSNMTFSDTLANPTTLVSIALALKKVGLSNMTFLQYPTLGDPANPNRVVPNPYSASILNAALIADHRVQLTGTPGRAAELAPSAPPAPTPTSTTASATPTPAPTPSDTAVSLPPSITGQTANQQTCTKKG